MIAAKLPGYSVLMSVYYKEKANHLRLSIDSIWNQTTRTNDFVLVCDGPLTAELDEVIKEAQIAIGSVLRVIRLEINHGLGEALNIGIGECKNEIIARMDSDDIAFPNRCEVQLHQMVSKDLDIISGNIIEFQETIDNITGIRKVPRTQDEIIQFSKKRNPFNHPAIMYRKSAVIAAGGYTEEYHLFEDYHLWVRMLMNNCKCENLTEPVLYMRTGSDAILRRGGRQYAKDMLRFHKWLNAAGWTSKVDYISGAIPHMLICIAPNRIRSLVYKQIR